MHFIPLAVTLLVIVGLAYTGVAQFKPRISYPLGPTQAPEAAQYVKTVPTAIPTSLVSEIPELYPDLQWEPTQRRNISFYTPNGSVQLDGFYIESVPLNTYPADFIAYYREEFAKRGWHETFSGIEPGGVTFGYDNNGHYFQFGIQPVSRVRSEYRAFVKHN